MSVKFWIKRFLVVLSGAFVLISAVQFLKGHDLNDALTEGVIWGLVTSTVFTVARYFQARRGQHCAICKDTPEMQDRSK